MYHNLQQAQQLINTIDQMASQIRQQEMSNRQALSQMEQREAQAAQKLQQMQQMCQECTRVLQNHQSYFRNVPMHGSFQQENASPMGFSNFGYQTSGVSLGQPQNIGTFMHTQTPLIDPTTMGASTYYDSLQQFGGSGNQNLYTPGGFTGLQSSGVNMGSMGQGGVYSGMGNYQNSGVNLGQPQNVGTSLQTQSPLIDPTTMGASTYNDSLRQFGTSGGNQNLYTAGGFTGLQSSGTSMGSIGQGGVFGSQSTSNFSGQGNSSGINMEISSLPTHTPFASTTTMGPDRYQSAAQKIGGANMSMSTVGQQSGITNR